MTWIQTYTGKAFRLSDITVDMNDIAHHLANRCRFNGACEPPYSVGEHSVRMSRVAQQQGHSVEIQQWCLLHDGAEAYLPDVPSPFKPVFRYFDAKNNQHHSFKWIEDQVLMVIANDLGIRFPMDEGGIVNGIDLRMLATEKRDLMCEEPEPWFPMPEPFDFRIIPWQWYIAKREFQLRYKELFDG